MSRRVKRPLAKSRASGDRPKGAQPYRGSRAERPHARPGAKPAPHFPAPRAEKAAGFIAEPEKVAAEPPLPTPEAKADNKSDGKAAAESDEGDAEKAATKLPVPPKRPQNQAAVPPAR